MTKQNREADNKVPERGQRDEQLRLDYKLFFQSDRGKKIMDDLKQRFGWTGEIERASAVVGMRNEEVWLREGMKQPIRHILSMMTLEQDTQPKATEAQHE
jgi:hypothetical protein